MVAPLRKLVAAAALVAGIAWVLPLHDNDAAGEAIGTATHISPTLIIEIRRNRLFLSGHTASAQHESHIREAVGTAFPGLEARFDFNPLGIVPDWWSEVTVQLVELPVSMRSGTVTLAEDALRVSALVNDVELANRRLEALRLPGSVQRNLRFEHVDTDISARLLCERQFSTFSALPIQFEESTTILRQSAYPALDKIAALADACREATVTITGHTDSSGNEDWNRILSHRRAQAVADYLVTLGVEIGRLEVDGLGSGVPVADNATRYGRSLNRRIDVRFSVVD